MNLEPTSASRHDLPADAYDEPYTFGHPPDSYLAMREIVRLTILRSKLGDRAARAGGQRD